MMKYHAVQLNSFIRYTMHQYISCRIEIYISKYQMLRKLPFCYSVYKRKQGEVGLGMRLRNEKKKTSVPKHSMARTAWRATYSMLDKDFDRASAFCMKLRHGKWWWWWNELEFISCCWINYHSLWFKGQQDYSGSSDVATFFTQI